LGSLGATQCYNPEGRRKVKLFLQQAAEAHKVVSLQSSHVF
jgi:hypothetical protein